MKKTVELSNGNVVEMQCPTVKVVKNAMKFEGGMEQTVYILAAACNMTTEEVDSLSFPDYMLLSDELNTFLGK